MRWVKKPATGKCKLHLVNKTHLLVTLGSVFPCTPAYHLRVESISFCNTVYVSVYLLTTFCIFRLSDYSLFMFFIVIDFCLEKCVVCDPETNFQSLRPQWASKASCTQRKGT